MRFAISWLFFLKTEIKKDVVEVEVPAGERDLDLGENHDQGNYSMIYHN